ncbi:SGNH/GDSL hydrolase family protein [Alicyclobacillus sp. SO9]|uniref:SGNH/GDSL hydrolase family protein n=1 Tax=Alicyclobacillus sp. SO9 TaxID=2665646 RepID=UPI0018E835EC|nr:SGNH/GDSL hydrolase family protein [Alicyclobacillus sp. SO9]QQE80274.1 SGNH/GDSL hydrolase family protein [Alicyclobacillus sp. SO9]
MFRYTALGDSITAGFGASSPTLAYPALVVKETAAVRRAFASNQILAEAGWNSEALLSALTANSALPLTQSSAITIWVGGDDLVDAGFAILSGSSRSIIKTTLVQYGKDIAAMTAAIKGVSRTPVVLCTQYNPFPNSPMAVEAIAALNSVTREVSAKLGTGLAPADAWFEGRQPELIAGYTTGKLEDVLVRHKAPIHPNNLGHRVIASNLAPILAS